MKAAGGKAGGFEAGAYPCLCLSALQYSDLIVTPITGQHAAGIGDLRHLGSCMGNALRGLDYAIF